MVTTRWEWPITLTRRQAMRFKLGLLVLFTAIMSFACAGTSENVRQGTWMGRQERPMTTAATDSYKPITIQRTDRVLGGRCEAKLTFDEKSGGLVKLETDTPDCVVTQKPLLVNGHELLDLSGSITFEGSCTICYPSVFGPPLCITKSKC